MSVSVWHTLRGIESQSHTILFVQFLDMEREIPLQDHIIVELVPVAQCSKPRARISSEGAQVESIHAQPHHVYEQQQA